MHRLGSFTFVPFVVALLAGCSDGPTAPGAGPDARGGVASVAVSPASLSLTLGATAALNATPRGADGGALSGHPITWTSTDTTVATVSAVGVVQARGEGIATIFASSNGKSGFVALTVTAGATSPTIAWILIMPAGGTIPQALGTSRQLGVVARASDGTEIVGRPVAWSSSDPTVASVSATGLLEAHVAGTAWIAAVVDGKRDSTLVTVPTLIARVEIDPAALALLVGDSRTITARALDAHGAPLARTFAWSSSNVAVATVDAAGGVVATGPGTAVITATSEGRRATIQITVTGRQLRLTDAAGAPLPATLDTVTVTMDGVARAARFQVRGGTLRFHDGRYELRLQGWLLAEGVDPVQTTVSSDGVLAYDVLTGDPMLFEGDDWVNRAPRFRGRTHEDGRLTLEWNRTPSTPTIVLGFAP